MVAAPSCVHWPLFPNWTPGVLRVSSPWRGERTLRVRGSSSAVSRTAPRGSGLQLDGEGALLNPGGTSNADA